MKLLVAFFCIGSLGSHLVAVDVNAETIELINATSTPVEGDTDAAEAEAVHEIFNRQNEEKRESISLKDQPIEDSEEEVMNYGTNSYASYYNTTHKGSLHKPVNISADGLQMEMEDKSIWQVHSWDASKLKKWMPYHTIVIAPNTNIFTKGSYPFKIINLDTQQVTKAYLKFKPVLNDPNIDIFVHWIENIDYNKRKILLEDGSLWDISWMDGGAMRSFDRYNIVIVGTNDGWFRSENPNILICVRNNVYICGSVIN